MIHAYQEIYLSKAQSVLGDVFDYAVNACGIPGSAFVKMFTMSTMCKRMENGEPAIIAGKSGIEIAIEIIEEAKGIEVDIEPRVCFERTAEYWIGWAVCYYQWYSCRKYREIFNALSYENL